MVLRSLSVILENYIPRNGNISALKTSRKYLDALKEGTIDHISRGLMNRLIETYDIPPDEFYSLLTRDETGYDPADDPDQELLHTFEQGARFSKPLDREVAINDYLTKENMVDILRMNEHTILVPGKLSRAVYNFANYFAQIYPLYAKLTGTLDEFPIVNEHGQSIAPTDFVKIEGHERDRTISLYSEDLPRTVSRLYTRNDLWKRRYEENPETISGYKERSVATNYNEFIIEFKKPLSQRVIDDVERDIYADSLFTTIQQGYGNVWLTQNMWMSGYSRDGNQKPWRNNRPIFVFDDQSSLRMRLYPFQVATPWIGSSFDQYRPTVDQMQLLNRLVYRINHPEQ
ncbi:MAG: hypothetical protein ACQESE_01685 [Nanobdellota archaeon]